MTGVEKLRYSNIKGNPFSPATKNALDLEVKESSVIMLLEVQCMI